jgi:hypothetical protein
MLASDPPSRPTRNAVAQQPQLQLGESFVEPQRLVLHDLTAADLVIRHRERLRPHRVWSDELMIGWTRTPVDAICDKA